MFRSQIRQLAVAVGCGVLLAVGGGVASANLLVNGSFEVGPDPGAAGNIFLATGSSAIQGWDVIEHPINYVGSDWQHANGQRSVGLNTSFLEGGPGGVRQIFATIPGVTYVVQFHMAGDPFYEPIKRLEVRAAGASAEFVFDATGHNYQDMGWELKQWQFTASSSSTTLEFVSLYTDSDAGPTLDNVLVEVDCNSNGVPDADELAADDCNSNGWLDECELAMVDRWAQHPVTNNGIGLTATVTGWDDALAEAMAYGGTLANPIDQETIDWIAATFDISPSQAASWIGVYNDGGVWTDVDGVPVTETFWCAGEPSLGGVRDYVSLCMTCVPNNRCWQDDYTTNPHYGIIELDGPPPADCNSNGVLDECDLADCDGSSDCQDCNGNAVPDGCELEGNDCNTNGIPDDCEADFDADGLIDDCDSDIDEDGVANELDACDYSPFGAAIVTDPTSYFHGTLPADLDDDCDVDLEDYALFAASITGPNGP